MLICLLLANIVNTGASKDARERQINEIDEGLFQMTDEFNNSTMPSFRKSLNFIHKTKKKANASNNTLVQSGANSAHTYTSKNTGCIKEKQKVYFHVYCMKAAIPKSYHSCLNFLTGAPRVCKASSFELKQDAMNDTCSAVIKYMSEQKKAYWNKLKEMKLQGGMKKKHIIACYAVVKCIFYNNLSYHITYLKNAGTKRFRVAWYYLVEDYERYDIVKPFLVFLQEQEEHKNTTETIYDVESRFLIAMMKKSTFIECFKKSDLYNLFAKTENLSSWPSYVTEERVASVLDEFASMYAEKITWLENMCINALHASEMEKFYYYIRLTKFTFWSTIKKLLYIKKWKNIMINVETFESGVVFKTIKRLTLFNYMENSKYLFVKRGDEESLFIIHKSFKGVYPSAIGGKVFIGKNVTMGTGTKIEDGVFINDGCDIGDNVLIGNFCTFNRNVKIGQKIIFGPNNFVNSNTTFRSQKTRLSSEEDINTKIAAYNFFGVNSTIGSNTSIGYSNIICNAVTIYGGSTIQNNVYIEGEHGSSSEVISEEFGSSSKVISEEFGSSSKVSPEEFKSSSKVSPEEFKSSSKVISEEFESSSKVSSEEFGSSSKVSSEELKEAEDLDIVQIMSNLVNADANTTI